MKRLFIWLRNELHEQLKQEAIRRTIETGCSVSMADIVRGALMKELQRTNNAEVK